MRHSEYAGRRTEMEHRSPMSRSMMSHQAHHQQRHYHHNHSHHLEMAALPPFNRDTTTTTMMSDTTTTVHASPMTTAFNADTKPVMTRMADHRRSNKPIMEKRRRARINSCLGELKGLILQAMKKDPSRHSKLEKADILEMTVKHLQNLQRQQMAVAVSTDPTVITKFRAGFSECATEVASYVGRIDGVDNGVRQRLVGHLRSCITGLNHLPSPSTTAAVAAAAAAAAAGFGGQPLATFQSASDALNILSRTPLTTVRDDSNNHAGTTLRMFAGLHLLPSRLPNGDIAFVLPHQHQDGRSSTTPPTSELSDDDDDDDAAAACDEDEYCESVNHAPALPPQFSTSDRRTPSAFTSVLNATTSANVQSNPQAIGESVSSTSSSSKDGVSSSTTAAGPSGTIVPSKQVVQQKAQMSTKVGLLRGLQPQPQPRPSTSSVCSTTDNEKMWRPW